ncbi:MAG: hypothetical protein E3K37_06135 [Candidatus Kuenenia sp.]|nr:hypothetical protein [Candidatus Kuenenia hertensis]
MKITLHIIIILFLLKVCIGCSTTCKELKENLANQIQEIKRICECDFTIECEEDFPGGGAVGLTIIGPDGRPLIKLPGGEQEVSADTLKHELIHAVDMCVGFSESHFPTPADLVGKRAEYIFIIKRRLLSEFIAYKCVGVYEEVPIDTDRFPDPDDNDRAILSAYTSLASSVVSTLPVDVRNELMTTLEAADLSPQQIRSSSDIYQNLKRDLIEEAERFKEQMQECIERILSSVS